MGFCVSVGGVAAGVAYCAAVACLSYLSWGFFRPVGPMMWSFVYGILLVNVFGMDRRLEEGTAFCSGSLLRFTVACLGFVTSALIWTRVGVGIFAAFAVILVGLGLSLWLGRRLGLSHRLAALVGAGTAICGASAIAALGPAIGAGEEESGLAVASVTLFGLASMFLYPFLFLSTPVGGLLRGSADVYAVWAGAGVHETAQVIAAAGAVGPGVVAAAMLIKSVRIFMIGPVVMALSWVCCRLEGGEATRRFTVPGFAVAFLVGTLACAGLDVLSPGLGFGLDWASLKGTLSGSVIPFMFATAFAGVGSRVRFASLLRLGAKPLLLGAAVTATAGFVAFACALFLAPLIA
jgi:uncharacterized integral membrane protein (TIGR00698 family)